MLILAHRGLPGPGRPENTLAAVAAAFDAGADGVEVDLRLTVDDVLALSHDPDLQRLTGHGPPIAQAPWAGLYAQAEDAGLRLARMEELIVLAQGRPVVLELKAPPPAQDADTRTAQAVVAGLRTLRAAGRAQDVRVSSFSPRLLAAVRDLLGPADEVGTALLGSPDDDAPSLLIRAVASGHQQIHPHVGSLLADPGVITAAHAQGLGIIAWTVNSVQDVSLLAELGADAIITDEPAAARAALTGRPSG